MKFYNGMLATYFYQGLRDCEGTIDDNINGMLATYFYHGLRDCEGTIDDNINGIDFDSLTSKQYLLITDAMKLASNIIENVIEQQRK